MVSSIKDLRDNLVSRESGKRLYVSPKEYSDQIRRPTIKGFDDGTQPWSEFEKPWLEDSYEEMEYFMWNFPGFPTYRWDFNFDNPSFPTTEQAALGGTEFIVCDCRVLGGFCPGETRAIAVDCNYPIIGVEKASETLYPEFEVFLVNSQTIGITADEGAGGGVEINIITQLPSGGTCGEDNILVGTAQDCEDCATADPLEEDPSNPTTVADGASYEIRVLNGVGPFSWTLSAPDSPNVSLQWAVGSRRYNYLIVVDGCGSIVVQVIDSCGTVVDIALRSTDGSWTNCCGSSRGGDCSPAGTVDPAAGCATVPEQFGGYYLTDTGNEDTFVHAGRTWRWRRFNPYDGFKCADAGIPHCCNTFNTPDCSPNPTCYGGCVSTCDGVQEPCYNPCGGQGATPKCGASNVPGDSVGFDIWVCV